MILTFSQKIKDKPTFFVEKILNCMHYDLKYGKELNDFLKYKRLGYNKSQELINKIVSVKPKRHTIRRDSKKRWKLGNLIHFYIDTRSPLQYLFAPVIDCISTQKIEIIYNRGKIRVYINERQLPLSPSKVEELAINDGFDSVDDFFEWFNEDFTGKIIHWTDLKY